MPAITRVKSARKRYDAEGNIKPLLTCDTCSRPIEVGSSYKHMSIKTGPYSSRQLVRCAVCPDWQTATTIARSTRVTVRRARGRCQTRRTKIPCLSVAFEA